MTRALSVLIYSTIGAIFIVGMRSIPAPDNAPPPIPADPFGEITWRNDDGSEVTLPPLADAIVGECAQLPTPEFGECVRGLINERRARR